MSVRHPIAGMINHGIHETHRKYFSSPSVYSVPSVVKKDFSNPAQRQKLFNQWFSDYQAAQTRQPFDLDAFWQYAEEQARALETEDSPPLGLSDYEQLKTWLFEQIRADKLEQAFSLDSKQIELKQK